MRLPFLSELSEGTLAFVMPQACTVPGTYQKPGKCLLGEVTETQAHQGHGKGPLGISDASSEAGDGKPSGWIISDEGGPSLEVLSTSA